MVWRPLFFAVQFLTRFPVRFAKAPAHEEIGRSVLFFPIVGFVVSLPLLAIGQAVQAGWIARLLGAALIVATWVMITGGLHLDGLADSADAWAGSRGQPDRALAIMKDPNAGPIGIVSLVMVLLIKFAAIADLLSQQSIWSLALAPILGRMALPLLFATTPYVRQSGLGEQMSAKLPKKTALIVVAGCAAIILILGQLRALASLVASIIAFFILRRWMRRMVGGMTGDTAGATVEVIETVCLIALAICR